MAAADYAPIAYSLTLNDHRIRRDERGALMAAREPEETVAVAHEIVDRLRDEGVDIEPGAALSLIQSKRDGAATLKAIAARDTKAHRVKEAIETHSIAELMRKEFAPTRWIVEGLLPQGTVLLAGKPKSGKSWLTLGLFVACRLHAEFLRCTALKCDGLYLALEDTDRRMQSRMRTLMLDCLNRIDELKGFEYRCDWPKGVEGAAELDRYLTTHPKCRMVAVDVLAKIRPAGDKRGAYEQDYEAIATWKTVADRHGILLLIVHHTRKAQADDVFDEVSGTLGINGAVDQIVVLKRLPNDPKRATLHMRGRDLEVDQELGLELRNGWWHCIGSAEAIAVKEQRTVILDLLRDADEPMSTTDILKATGKRSRPSLSRLLSRMVTDRQIHRQGGRYAPGPAL